MKTFSHPAYSLAEHSKYFKRYSLQNLATFSTLTRRGRSALLPTSTNSVARLSTCLRVSSYQKLVMASREMASSRSSTKTTQWVLWKQELAMLQKRSCPAVSQICNLTLLPATSRALNWMAEPMVVAQTSVKVWQMNCVQMEDLPTPDIPTRTSLYSLSYYRIIGLYQTARKLLRMIWPTTTGRCR